MSRTLAAFRQRFYPVIVLIALSTIPLLYAGLLTWANIDPTHHLDRVPAAVVNLDEPAQKPSSPSSGPDSGSSGAPETVNVGDELTKKLVDSTEAKNFDWVRMSPSDAQDALEQGRVLAVLTIPRSFSADVVSVGDEDPTAAARAKLTIATNDGANMIVGNIAASVGTAVADSLKEELSSEYLTNVYAGFTSIHEGMSDAVNGSGKLADGAADAKDGSGELVVGLDRLESGSGDLADGAGRLAGGARDLDSGAKKLDTGATDLDRGAAKLSTGIGNADDGAHTLARGLSQLEDGTKDLPEQVSALKRGTSQLREGSADLADGTGKLRQNVTTATDAISTAADGAQQALDGAETLREGARTLASSTPTLATGAQDVNDGLGQLEQNWAGMSDEQKLAAVQQLHRGAGDVADGAKKVDTGATDLADGAKKLVGTVDPATGEGDGLARLAAGVSAIKGATGQLEQGVVDLDDGAVAVRDGAKKVDDGVGKLDDGMGPLARGIADASTGASDLADGTSQLRTGGSTLAAGASDLASGAGTLSDGTGKLADSSDQLASGAETLKDGTEKAASGAGTLDSGLSDLRDGADTLHTGIEDGQKDVPTYSASEQDHLASVAGDPVQLSKERQHEVEGYGGGLAPYFMGLSLWVGAMGFFMMMPALSARRAASRMLAPFAALLSFLPAAGMAAVQSALMVLVVHLMVGIDMAHLGWAFGIAFLTSLTFFAINQALVAALGAPGRYVALVLIVLQLSAAGGTYPVATAPGFYQSIHSWLPMSYVVQAFRTVIAGGSIGITDAVIALLGFMLSGLVVTMFAVLAQRWLAAKRGPAEEGLGHVAVEA